MHPLFHGIQEVSGSIPRVFTLRLVSIEFNHLSVVSKYAVESDRLIGRLFCYPIIVTKHPLTNSMENSKINT